MVNDEYENFKNNKKVVNSLEVDELSVLQCIVSGYSDPEISDRTGMDVQQVQTVRNTMMKKIEAKVTADAVRIGLYAGVAELPLKFIRRQVEERRDEDG